MITSSWPRLVIGTLVLMIGNVTGMFAWSIETCAANRADSLWIGALVLAGNVIAWLLLGRRVPSKPVLLVSFLPALAALSYTASTVQLVKGYVLHGLSSCSAMRTGVEFGWDGREPIFTVLWLLACLSFWGGLVPVVMRAIRVHGGSSTVSEDRA